jgi:hypothetical protein
MRNSEENEYLKSLDAGRLFFEKSVFWSNEEKWSPTHGISEGGFRKKMVRYMISPKMQMGSNVEILRISTFSLWSRSRTSHTFFRRHPFLLDSSHRFDFMKLLVTG